MVNPISVIAKALKNTASFNLVNTDGQKRYVELRGVKVVPGGLRFTVSEGVLVRGKVVFTDVYYELTDASVRETGRRESTGAKT